MAPPARDRLAVQNQSLGHAFRHHVHWEPDRGTVSAFAIFQQSTKVAGLEVAGVEERDRETPQVEGTTANRR